MSSSNHASTNSAVELTRAIGSWVSTTSLAERLVTIAILLLPGAYLAVYCHQMQVPFPALGAGLGLFLGVILLFLFLGLAVVGYSFVAPAVISAVVFPPEAVDAPERQFDVSKRIFAVWFGLPLALCCLLLWVCSHWSISDARLWMWAVVPLVVITTSYWASRQIAVRAVGAGKTGPLTLLAMGWLVCAAVAVTTYIGPLSRGVKTWPELLQWMSLLVSVGLYACLIYLQSSWPNMIRKHGRRRMALTFAFVLVGVALVVLVQPVWSTPVVGRFLSLMQRGGGEPVEIIIAADVAMAEGLLTTRSTTSMVRCRAELLLDFGDETSVRFAGQSHVSHMRATEFRRVLRSPRSEGVNTGVLKTSDRIALPACVSKT